MHPLQQVDLPKLRRQLEEILAMVNTDHHGPAFNRVVEQELGLAVQHENNAITAEAGLVLADDHLNLEIACEPVPGDMGQEDERDDLFDDALLVVTEFGQASPAILQMWLSIDYGRAIKILNRFQADGLISSKGKVRHKAFSLRHSFEQQG